MNDLDRSEPVACSLGDEALRERRALFRKLLLSQVTNVERTDSGLRLTFAEGETVRENIETFVDLERQCCGFLSFTVLADRGVSLTIDGPPEAQPTVDMIARSIVAG